MMEDGCPQDAPSSETDDATVSVEGLRYSVDGREILCGIDFRVRRGEVFGVVGMSGCGKTTLLRCVASLARPAAGRIRIAGTETASLGERELFGVRRKIGMIFQYSALFDSLSVYENVAFGLKAGDRVPDSEAREVVGRMLGLVGMQGTEELYPAQLSGGMQKRVGIARALATNPEVLLYDEPTSGLDPIMSGVINRLMEELSSGLGVTSILVSHDIGSLLRICGEVAMLHEGRLRGLGTSAEFAASDDPAVRQFVDGSAHGPIKT
jgi:phospholipid/cholesterol/gamma-HCH transport system ATP-binding protein